MVICVCVGGSLFVIFSLRLSNIMNSSYPKITLPCSPYMLLLLFVVRYLLHRIGFHFALRESEDYFLIKFLFSSIKSNCKDVADQILPSQRSPTHLLTLFIPTPNKQTHHPYNMSASLSFANH